MSDDEEGAASAAPKPADGAEQSSETGEAPGVDAEDTAETESADRAESGADAETDVANAADSDDPQPAATTPEPVAEAAEAEQLPAEPGIAHTEPDAAHTADNTDSADPRPAADAEQPPAEPTATAAEPDPLSAPDQVSAPDEISAPGPEGAEYAAAAGAASSGPPTAVMEPVREPETQVIERVEPDTERLPENPLAAGSGMPLPVPALGSSAPAPAPSPSEPDRSNRTLLVFGAIVVAVLIIGALGAIIGSTARHGSGSSSGSGGPGTAAISIPASGVSVVELDGVAGKVSINAAATSSVSSVEISSGSPAVLGHQFDAATHTLDLSCATDSGNCPAATYTVTIPQHLGLTLHQISGQTTITGVSGPVSVTANSASTTATGLTAGSFTAVITSGQLDAAFTGVPQHVSVSVISSQATLHLPGSAQYAVDEQIISGNANVQIPRVASAPNVVEANVTSGQITLLAD